MTARMRSGLARAHGRTDESEWRETVLLTQARPPRQSKRINEWADKMILAIGIVSIVFFVLGMLG